MKLENETVLTLAETKSNEERLVEYYEKVIYFIFNTIQFLINK